MAKTMLLGLVALTVGAAAVPALAEYPSPLKQIQSGTEPDDILCNADRVLAVRDGGDRVCVTEETAHRTGWILHDDPTRTDAPHPINVPHTDMPDSGASGTTGPGIAASGSEDRGWSSPVSSLCFYWPKDISFALPGSMRADQEFDVMFGYTFVTHDIHAAAPGAHPAKLLGGPRDGCDDGRLYMITNEKLDLVSQAIFEKNETNTKTGRVYSSYYIDYPFNNTSRQTENITLRFNSLPDRYDLPLILGTVGKLVTLEHFVDRNGTIHLTPAGIRLDVIDVTGPAASLPDSVTDESDFYTKEITLPPRPDPIVR